jgi:hypothetical protein
MIPRISKPAPKMRNVVDLGPEFIPFENLLCQPTLWEVIPPTFSIYFDGYNVRNDESRNQDLCLSARQIYCLASQIFEDEARAKENSCYQAVMERQSETPLSTQMEHAGALPDREEQLGSRYGNKALHKPDRQTELVDSSPCRLYKPIACANNRSVNTFQTT